MKIITAGILLFVFTKTSGQNSSDSLKNYFASKAASLHTIEGIWQVDITKEAYHYDTLLSVTIDTISTQVALIVTKEKIKMELLSGDSIPMDLSTTAVKNVYLWHDHLSTGDRRTHAVICKSGAMQFTLGENSDEWPPREFREVRILNWRKIFPDN